MNLTNFTNITYSLIVSLDNREISALVFIAILIILALIIKGSREQFPSIIKAFLSLKILLPWLSMVIYILLIVQVLEQFNFWNIGLAKDTLFWYFSVAMPLFFNANNIISEKNYFKSKIFEYIKFSTILSFFINFYTFDLALELILQFGIVLIIMLLAVSRTEEKYKVVEECLNVIFVIILIIFIILSIYNIFIAPNEFFIMDTLIEYVLPPILTILFLTFIYFLGLYMKYEIIYVMRIIKIGNKKLEKYTILKLLRKCHLNVYFLNKFSQQLQFYKGMQKKDIDNQFFETEKKFKK